MAGESDSTFARRACLALFLLLAAQTSAPLIDAVTTDAAARGRQRDTPRPNEGSRQNDDEDE
jgi:hypothetical protein